MLVPNKHGTSRHYRFGFNGKEKDDELKGEGNSIDYEARMHDTRVGRFLSIDPLFKSFAWFSPFQFAGNSPISCVDLDGLEMYFAADGSFLGQSIHGGTEIRIATKYTTYNVNKKGVITQGYQITSSKRIDQFDFATQGKVYQKIYDREVKGNANVFATDDAASSTGAYTEPPLGVGAIKINTDFAEVIYSKAGDIIGNGPGNKDYYTATANLKHEEKHFKGMSDNAGFDHFQVWAQTDKLLKKDGTYSKLNDSYKAYLNNVGAGYIQDMEFALSKPNTVSSKDFNFAYNLYKENVKTYNEITKSNHKTSSKKDFLDARKNNKN